MLTFHQGHLTEYLWPRSLDQIRDLSRQECLFEVVERTGTTNIIVGACYITHAKEIEPPFAERNEFGGIYVSDDCRGLGLATALGFVAIGNLFMVDPPKGRLIAHVHEENSLPRRVLKQQGFVQNGQEIPPRSVVPLSMKRNKDGDVVGDLFVFDTTSLTTIADWIHNFPGTINGKNGKSLLEIELPSFARMRADLVKALRDRA
ncbi:MAG TPA: hypothetical protein VGK03_00540 [Geothrix sp.]|jgi:RimJ/RimL family protein N-acetyltransferase